MQFSLSALTDSGVYSRKVCDCYLLHYAVSCCAFKRKENAMGSGKAALNTWCQLYKKTSLKRLNPFGQYHPFCHCNGEELPHSCQICDRVCKQCKIRSELVQCVLVKQERVWKCWDLCPFIWFFLLAEVFGLCCYMAPEESHRDAQRAGVALLWRKAEGTGLV